MSHFLLKFERAGDGPGSEQAMIQSDSIGLARDKADEIADASGGRSSILRLFDDKGLVATRSGRGLWST